jgi:rhodanese-related sulfurtransferase
MQQLIEFVGNHPLLAAGFAAVLGLLIWTEVVRKLRGLPELTPAQAVAWINDPAACVVDVSPAVDFNKGHIVNARNVPVSRITQEDPEVRKLAERKVLVVCKTGQTSAQAATSLQKLGVRDIAVLRGGMARWIGDQYPVTTG